MVRRGGFKTLQIVKWVMLMWSQNSKHTPTWTMLLVAISGEEKSNIWLQELWRDMSVWVIQVLLGQVSCFVWLPPPWCGHTHSQIKSFLWSKVCDWEKWMPGRGTHTQRKKTKPSFSKTVTHSDWERVSQELWVSCTGSNTSSHG